MKRLATLFVTLTLLFSMACNSGAGQSTPEPPSHHEMMITQSGDHAMKDTGSTASNILVAYFSATGTTKSLAEYAADILNADSYEIVAQVPYTGSELAYNTNGRAGREQNDVSARPAISGHIKNMQQYDTVLLSYPIWHG